ncbi:MAG TPA: hypothetical protein PL053_00830 [Deltaproteobacteria bacterium]|nr:hypothetical protein [Deltaproteobacteria bacterium]
MKTVFFTARLLSDAVISERSATMGGHSSLDYIPGSTLLGAAASQLYSESFADSFTVFHSGKVRFSNAYPLDESGLPTMPVPLSWHIAKGKELKTLADGSNLIHAGKSEFDAWDEKGEQQKQLRSGYFSPSGQRLAPQMSYRLKTAVDRENHGGAAESQLFGYESLAQGSDWYFSVSFDDDISPEVVEKVSESLNRTMRVGRSRSAEYGMLKACKTGFTSTAPEQADAQLIVLYCMSDLALTDPTTGSPVLIPDPELFGLENAELNPCRSYLRTRSYAPFNGTRKRFDLERQVLTKGSVIAIERPGGNFSKAELEALQQKISRGIGLYRQDGLGQLLLNPGFLSGLGYKSFEVPAMPLPVEKVSGALPPLAGWLKSKSAEKQAEIEAIELVDGWIRQLVSASCPSNSQWGQLRNIAVQGKDLEMIRTRLNKLCSEGVSQKQWNKDVRIDGKRTTYGRFLLETVLAAPLNDVRKRLYLLGNRLPRKQNQNNGGKQ